MPSTILDSAVFRDIFTTQAMRNVFSDENRVQKYLDFEAALARAQARLKIIPQEAADEIVAHCDLKFMDMAKLKEATERIGYPVLPVVQQLVAACKDKLGEWSHWGATTQDITDTATVLQIREALAILEQDIDAISRCAGRARQEIPRHADGRPQQPATGGADHLRLQDGDHAGRLRTPQAAFGGAEAARPGRRIRRRRRHAVLARQGRPEGAGRADEGIAARATGDFLAHRARLHRRGRLLPRSGHRLVRQDRLRREAHDADGSRGSLRAVPRRPRLVLDHAAEAQPDFVRLHHRADRHGEAARAPRCWRRWSRTTSARPGRGRSNGSHCRTSSCCRPARLRRRAFWSRACR